MSYLALWVRSLYMPMLTAVEGGGLKSYLMEKNNFSLSLSVQTKKIMSKQNNNYGSLAARVHYESVLIYN